MRLKPVTVNSIAGTSVRPADEQQDLNGVAGVDGGHRRAERRGVQHRGDVHRRTVSSRSRSSSPEDGDGIRIGSERELTSPESGGRGA